MKKQDLCGKCAALMKDTHKLRKVSGGIDNKVVCDHCGRTRYGATYEVETLKNKEP